MTEQTGWTDDLFDEGADPDLLEDLAASGTEVVETEIVELDGTRSVYVGGRPAPLDTLPMRIEASTREALVDYRDRDAVDGLVQDVRLRVLTAVRVQYAEHRQVRPGFGMPGKPNATEVAAELRFLADAENVLGGLATSLKAGADEARVIAGHVILDVEPEREIGTASVSVGLPGGSTLKATRSQASKVEVRQDQIVDVLVAKLVGEYRPLDNATVDERTGYARGGREAVAALLELVGPLSWKSTALDDLCRRLEGAGEDDLAIRLGHAYGRVSTGNPSTKLEVVEPKAPRKRTAKAAEA